MRRRDLGARPDRKSPSVRRGLVSALAMLAATALVGAALAQPRRTAPKPKPKAAAAVDAEAPAAAAATEETASTPIPGSQAPAGASALDGGPVPAPPGRSDMGDGGIRPSPLNPAANEMPPTVAPAPSASAAVDYDKLLGDIAALRARVAAVGDSLFVARIALAVETDGSHAKIGKMTVSLDDGVVYAAPANFHAEDMTTIYDHAVAAGRHAVTVDIDRQDDRDESFRDTEHSRFVVDVPPDQKLNVTLRLGDESNMGSFPADRYGKYDVRVRMHASAAPVKR
jgi:hypothetical protein